MLKATLRGLAAHKLRLALTALAIVLGVSFVTGTYVLTDTISKTFDELFQNVTEGVDVFVRGKDTVSDQQGGELRTPLPAALATQIREVDGVKLAEGSVTGYAQFVKKDGKPVTTGGAPTLGVSMGSAPELSDPYLRSGRMPTSSREVVMDTLTARKYGFAVGDRVKVLTQSGAGEFSLVGLIGFGDADNLAGATLAGFDLATAQRLFDKQGRYDEINVVGNEGVSETELRDRVAAAIADPRYETLTRDEYAKANAQSISDTIGRFLGTALLAFAGVALLVGAFLIFNTFTIVLAQRTRELALLRCLGASRRQVLNSVLLESAVVGLIASVVGLGAGVLVAIGLRRLLEAFGGELPTTSLQLLPRTVIVALAVGIGITLISAVMPALKATRVPPVAALREELAATAPRRIGRLRVRGLVGTLITAVGVALLAVGLFQNVGNRLANLAAGAVVIFLGVAVLSPLFARPLARAIGWPIARAFREPGKLARLNAMRNPRRTASTAAALMIGLALVTFVSILAASIKASATETLDRSIAADYILNTEMFTPFSPELAKQLARQPELEAVAAARVGAWKLRGQTKQLIATDPATYDRVVRTEATAGTIAGLSGGGLAVKDTVAESEGWKVGDTVPMEFLGRGVQQVPLKAIYKDNSVNGDFLLSLRDYERFYDNQADQQVLVRAKAGVAPADSRAAIERVLTNFPNVQVRDQAEYKAEQARQVDQLLALVSALLGLAILIALFGIVNTLALSIFERVRELGLLRAVGATRGQLRRMIRWEAVIIAVLGAVFGLVVGSFFGWAVVRALKDLGITVFSVPGGQLVGYVVAAAVAGVLAAILPGRRAAKVDMLRAIAAQ
jgi:putative ABC transport system permease protein